jgi:mutator protein MutT
MLKRKNNKKDKKNKQLVKLAGGVLVHEGKILIGKRMAGDTYGGYWEIPGGKVEKGENLAGCVKRELKEELDISVDVKRSFYKSEIIFKNKIYRFSFHECKLIKGNPKAKEVADFKWEKPGRLMKYKFPPANYKLVKYMIEHREKFGW